jgi:hypothetical protein
VRKINPAFAGKFMAVAVACGGIDAELVKARWLFSFLIRRKVLHTCRPLHCTVVIVILAHAIARVLKTEKSWLEGG